VTPLQAFLLGILVAYTPALLVLAWFAMPRFTDEPGRAPG
jgi:hypothetical protein